MTKIKEAVDNHKNYEKFHMKTIVAHNGVLVNIVVSSYEETKFDKIMADCKRQEKERKRERRREKIKLINLFTGKREKREIA